MNNLKSGVGICIKDLEIKVNHYQDKELKCTKLIHSFTANIQPSSLCALLGGSGSGKTTLLNVLANRYNSSTYSITGTVYFYENYCSNGGIRQTIPNRRNEIGYVTQEDCLLPFLTVRETLTFMAKLKIPKDTLFSLLHREESLSNLNSNELEYDKLYSAVVDEVILDLGLKEVADSFVGKDNKSVSTEGNGSGADTNNSNSKRGISGGEKRRVSVGMQILSNPTGK